MGSIMSTPPIHVMLGARVVGSAEVVSLVGGGVEVSSGVCCSIFGEGGVLSLSSSSIVVDSGMCNYSRPKFRWSLGFLFKHYFYIQYKV